MMKRDIQLLFELGSLRFIKRNWIRFLYPNVQNVSEHIFRVAWISMLLSKMEKQGDMEKILKMALVHDIEESRCGDTDYVSRLYVEQKDEKAISDMVKDTAFEYLMEVWNEYMKRESIEAKIVKDADNLDVQMEMKEQIVMGFRQISKDWEENRKHVFGNLFTESAKELWKEIKDSNPHDWHVKGVNRFTEGDWKG